MKLSEEILFCAFRYALGLRTYIFSSVSEEIIDKWDEISPKIQFLIQKEIKDAIESERAGSKMDVNQWKKILELPIKNSR